MLPMSMADAKSRPLHDMTDGAADPVTAVAALMAANDGGVADLLCRAWKLSEHGSSQAVLKSGRQEQASKRKGSWGIRAHRNPDSVLRFTSLNFTEMKGS